MYYKTLREKIEESKKDFIRYDSDKDDEITIKIKDWISKGESYESILTRIKAYKNESQKNKYFWAYSILISDKLGEEGKSINDYFDTLEKIYDGMHFYNEKEYCITLSSNRFIIRKLILMLDTATDEELIKELETMHYKLDLFILKHGKYQIYNLTKKMYYKYAYTE